MMDKDFRVELERRLDLYEDPESEEGVLGPLPAGDIAISVVVLALSSLGLLGWCFL
ncbi:hypothetical protein [Brevibacterium renqingii]|uniref:hypothetical protein n=1 Tax=Brevibacterium renqingii TaxID=2776916 RepID=UPI001AE0E4CA|nr:hypothetical protein [Brevibacterium renqingii]